MKSKPSILYGNILMNSELVAIRKFLDAQCKNRRSAANNSFLDAQSKNKNRPASNNRDISWIGRDTLPLRGFMFVSLSVLKRKLKIWAIQLSSP